MGNDGDRLAEANHGNVWWFPGALGIRLVMECDGDRKFGIQMGPRESHGQVGIWLGAGSADY